MKKKKKTTVSIVTTNKIHVERIWLFNCC